MTYFPLPCATPRKPSKCPGCAKWFVPTPGMENVSCCVAHAPGSCCHYSETEVTRSGDVVPQPETPLSFTIPHAETANSAVTSSVTFSSVPHECADAASTTTAISRRAMTLIGERPASAFVVYPCNCWCCKDFRRAALATEGTP